VIDDAVAEDRYEEDDAPVEIGDVADRASDPETTDAVDALDGVDLDGGRLEDLEADRNADAPDENEVMSASAEAGALIDGNPPLDEVFPDEYDATSVRNDVIESEIAAGSDQPDSATRGPRISANGGEAGDAGDENKPKRTGWWARRSFF